MRHFLAAVIVFAATAAQAQNVQLHDNRDPQLKCDSAKDRKFCEMKEQTVNSAGDLAIDDLHNGSVTIRGWARTDVMVRLRLEANARSDSRAKELASRVHIDVRPGRVSVDGPDWENIFGAIFENEWWSVSAEVFVPYRTSLRLTTHNGPIAISDIDNTVQATSHNGGVRVERVTGQVRAESHNGALHFADLGRDLNFDAHNGAVTATRMGGSVRGTSHNGPIEVELAGASFTGRAVDVGSHNGGVTIGVPKAFSAHVRASTNHGGVHSDFPTPARGRNARSDQDNDKEFDIGSGGPPMRLNTHNGSIRVRQIS